MSHLYDITVRFWEELIARPSGTLGFRFIIQPVMASLLAIRDGYRDASRGHTAYFWAVLTQENRSERLREGILAVSRVLILGCVADAIYQFVELKGFRPLQMIAIALLLAFIPYLFVRGPANRIARWLMTRRCESGQVPPLRHL